VVAGTAEAGEATEAAEVAAGAEASETDKAADAGEARGAEESGEASEVIEGAEAGEASEAIEGAEAGEASEAVEGAEAGDAEDAAKTEQAAAEEASAADTDETATPARIPVNRLLTAAVAAAVVAFVGAGAFAGATLQPYLADRAMVHTKLDIARTATNAITTLWTYSPDDVDSLPDRAAKYLAGDFQDQYRKFIDAIAPMSKQAKVTNSTQVVGAAVESLNGGDATAVVYTNTTNSSPQSRNIPSILYLSYRLTMQRHDSRWLITRMAPVTSVDLTPRLG
jgi:Mce-associated membrane protein